MTALPVLATGTAMVTAGRCTGCGNCCVVTQVNRHGMVWIRAMDRWVREGGGSYDMNDRNHRDAAFMNEHWHTITPEEAAARRPANWDEVNQTHELFKCDAYDPATARCTRYHERPPICRDFPYYGFSPRSSEHGKLGSQCGYWQDFPQEEWPEYVDAAAILARASQQPDPAPPPAPAEPASS